MQLLNRNNLAVHFAASREETRWTKPAILVTTQETVATDGHVLARVSMPNADPSAFPVIDGFTPNGFEREIGRAHV